MLDSCVSSLHASLSLFFASEGVIGLSAGLPHPIFKPVRPQDHTSAAVGSTQVNKSLIDSETHGNHVERWEEILISGEWR